VRGPVWRGSVRAGRDALPRDPAWRVNAGWITNGRDSITVLYVPIGAYSRLRFIGQATPERVPTTCNAGRPIWTSLENIAYCGTAGSRYQASDRRDAISHPYFAPTPNRTAGIVQIRIFKSSQIDQLSMYLRSSFTHVSNSFSSLRPLICHRQVIPGLTLRRRR
jgi:hypothetical protein